MRRSPVRRVSGLAERIRAILNSRGLTAADVSRSSSIRVSGHRPDHVPHNLYEAIRKRGFSPSLYQLAALARLSGYRLADWLGVFGLSLGEVARLQASFPASTTVEIDAGVYHPDARIPWFEDIRQPAFSNPFAPLSLWIAPAGPVRLDSLAVTSEATFRYVRIGSQDDYAFPDLIPGSIARVNTREDVLRHLPVGRTPPDHLFLVEHSRGLVCSRLWRPKPTRVVLSSRHLPYAPVELEIGTEVSILGIVDLEIRPIANVQSAQVPANLGRFWTPSSLAPRPRGPHAGEFIRRARERCGLSFREASERTRKVAEILGDVRYFCASGSLSDYETSPFSPRHVHKLISICAVYFASAAGIISAAGVDLDSLDKLAIPVEFMEPTSPKLQPSEIAARSSFLEEMKRRFLELPVFLHPALPTIFGLPELSIRDVFWLGGKLPFLHPYLAGAIFLIVDRKRKTPRAELTSAVWDQPLYIVQRRDGAYFCGACALQEANLVVRPWIEGLPKLLRFRHRVDVEIVGQVVGIVRHMT